MTFNELNIAEPILKAVCEKGYNEPTPIQEQAIPVVLRGKDIFGIAQTGTGKTAAFAIPILQMLSEDSARDERSSVIEPGASRRDRRGRSHGKKECRAIRSLILTPTRELALQIGDCFTDYGKYTGLKHTAIFGGVKQNPQTEKLRQGVDILIATPGRLLDLTAQGEVKLDALTHFVLDEADRMLDMGFIADIRRLLKVLPAKRQTLFFSATMPKDIVALSGSILHDPVRVEVTPVSSTVDTVDQCVYFVEKPEKKGLLISVLKKESDQSVLVFSRTKHGADNISRTLKKAGIQSEAIHGNKSQGQRQRALSDFKSGKIKVMVATDIAARGIDVSELHAVINYDLPDVAETYVHRIGRTGRAGRTGKAFNFVKGKEVYKLKEIQRYCKTKIKAQPIPSSDDVAAIKADKILDGIGQIIEDGDLRDMIELIEQQVNNSDYTAMDIAAAFLKQAIGGVELLKEDHEFDDALAGDTGAEEGMVRLFINIGKSQRIRPGDILGAVAGEAKIPGKLVGAIDMYDNYTFVEVPQEYGKDVLKAMKNVKIKGKSVNVEPANAR